MAFMAVNAQDVDAIEAARQAKAAAEKAAADAAAATEAAIEQAAAKAAKEAREGAKRKKEEDAARKAAEEAAAEEAELDAAAAAAAEEAKRKMAAELGIEIEEVSDEDVAEAVEAATEGEEGEEGEEFVVKESTGFNIGATGSLGFVNGAFITNTPTGGSLVITTPYGFKIGPFDYTISIAIGSYSGKSDGTSDSPDPVDFNPIAIGLGGNLTLANFIFAEGHIGTVGAGPGIRGFSGVSLEYIMKKGLNLPFNILIGGEGFISSEPSEGREEASYWGGLGVRLDYSL